jgi:hypothetical protein
MAPQLSHDPLYFSAHGKDVLERFKRQLSRDELINLSPEELCKDRLSEEYFRLTTEGDCRDVVRLETIFFSLGFFHNCKNALLQLSLFSTFRCDRAGLAGTIRLAAVRCPAGLAFDITRQTCDWKRRVENCDRLSSKTYYIPIYIDHI